VSPRIGLVVLDYDQAPITRRCLRSVAAGTRLPDEIVLVENGEHAVDLKSDEELTRLRVNTLSPGRNVGVAAGRNLGIDHLIHKSDVELVVMLDNDTTVPPEFFELAAARSYEPLEVVAPLILDMDSGEVIYAGGDYDRHHVPRVIAEWPQGETEPREVGWAPTAGLIVNRETWLRVGGFDPWYIFLWEDVEWCYRVVGLSGVVRVVPELRVLHEAHQSTGGAFGPERVRQWSRNGTVFLFQTAHVSWRSRLSWFVTELRRVVRELRAGWTPTAMGRLRGLAQGLREVGRRRLRRTGG
jgi:GT2 family glycosyltransferase